ncbi:MAG: hypothetical protein V8R88_08950 [Faecalibacterium prausnitzii]
MIGTAPSAKEKQKRDMQLDHLRAPFFVFIRETPSVMPDTGSSLKGELHAQVRKDTTFGLKKNV